MPIRLFPLKVLNSTNSYNIIPACILTSPLLIITFGLKFQLKMNSQNFSFCESFWNFVKSILYWYGDWIRFGSLFADWTRYRVFDFPFSHWQRYICSAPHPHRTSCSEVGSQPLLPKELSSICCQVFLTRRSHTGVQFNFYCFFRVSSIL